MVSVAASTSAETLWLNCSASTLMPSTYRELERQWEERMCFLPIRASSCQLRTVGLCRLSHGIGQPPTMHAAYRDLRVDVGFFGRFSSGSRYDPIEPPGGKGLGPQTPASHASCTTESVRYRLIWASGRTSEA